MSDTPMLTVLPVMDLQGGIVVRGVAGQRATYQPIRSQIADDASPQMVARGLQTTYGFRDVYLADLDAIAGDQPNWHAYKYVAESGLSLMVDAGISDVGRAELFQAFGKQHAWLSGIVVGLESVASPQHLNEFADVLGTELAVFSLDLKNTQPITAIEKWRRALPEHIVGEAIESGFRRVIVLDLAAVGTDRGPATTELCRALRQRFPFLEIISGGGVRSTNDIRALRDAGCDRVLVASALHDGRLRPTAR